MADIRNLRNPFDKKRKEKSFFHTLRLQAKLAQEYNDAIEEKGDSQKLGITPVAPKARDPMEEQRDISAQRTIAIENLRTVTTPDIADKIAQQLIAVGDASDLYYVNTNWERLKQAIGGRKNITDTYFRALLQRFRQQQQETEETLPTGEVVETGLVPTAREGIMELRDELDLMTARQAFMLSNFMKALSADMQNQLLTGLASIAPQIQTHADLVKLVSDVTGETPDEVIKKLGFAGTAPTTPLKTPTTPALPMGGVAPVPYSPEKSIKYTKDDIEGFNLDQLAQINLIDQDKAVIQAIAVRIETINNPSRPSRGKGSEYVVLKDFPKLTSISQKIQVIENYLKPLAGAKGGAEEAKERTNLFTPVNTSVEPKIEDSLRLVALMETGQQDKISEADFQEQLNYLASRGRIKPLRQYDVSSQDTLNRIIPNLKKLYLQRYDTIKGPTDPEKGPYYEQIKKDVEKKGSGIHFTIKQPKLHRKGYQTLMLPREGNRRIVGRGVEPKPKPRYAQFGKFVIHLPSLNKGILNLKYTSLSNITNIPQQSISTKLTDFIHDLLDSGVVNKDLYYKLVKDDQRLFTKVAGIAEIDDGMGYRNKFHESEKEEMDRFNLVKGIFMAGSNAPEVIKELQGFIRKFLNEGKISKGEGLQLLQEISVLT